MTDVARGKRRQVRRPETRQVVPRSEHPNFRDHGRMVDRPLLDLLSRLQKRHGRAYASEAGLRQMICEDTGHMPGVGTLPAASKRLGEQGLLVDVWLTRGNILPSGESCNAGVHLLWVPRTDGQKAAARAFNKEHGRKPYRNRLTGHDAHTLLARLGAAARPSMPARGEDVFDPEAALARTEESLATARAWVEAERAAGRDPDKPPRT